MSLRCLLFSSNEEMVQPIWQVLTDLGIEGEYCRNAVDAVERVTTQLFQIVITDWEDQPEAGFLLKTARDLKAAHRPLTLAIVSDSAKLPEALQAGANSVLMKPIRIEQVRDTMSTACELLRSKERPAGNDRQRRHQRRLCRRCQVQHARPPIPSLCPRRRRRVRLRLQHPSAKSSRRISAPENSCNRPVQRREPNSTQNRRFRGRWSRPQPPKST